MVLKRLAYELDTLGSYPIVVEVEDLERPLEAIEDQPLSQRQATLNPDTVALKVQALQFLALAQEVCH